MNLRNTTTLRATSLTAVLTSALLVLVPFAAVAQVVAAAPYTATIFATSPPSTSQPDSIVVWRDRVIVGFANGVAKDGSDHKFSTIVEFSLSAQVLRTFSVPGHNDGLRLVGDDKLWALQNEDGNPNLVVIDLESGQPSPYNFAATPHGGGYDDMVVVDGHVYLTASNPTLNTQGINVFPALVRATLWKNNVMLEPVLSGNANAIDIPSGGLVTLNLTDPDSMSVDPLGNIVLDSQADSELVFVRHVGTPSQEVGRLEITSSATGPGGATITLDDTAFVPKSASGSYLLVTDLGAGVIYRIDRATFGFEPGQAYSASDTLGLVGTLNLDDGTVTPVITGMSSARGLVFVTAAGGDEPR
jgi:hypothetical protein